MAATVQIEQITGPNIAGATYTVKSLATRTRYYTADDSGASNTTNPIPIPTTDSGFSGSYWVTHCINATSPATQYIKNVRWYITYTSSNIGEDWNLGNKGDLYIGISGGTIAEARASTQGFPSSAYDQGDGVAGSFGYFISSTSNGHTYYRSVGGALSGGCTSTADFNSLSNAYWVQSGNIQGTSGGRSYCIVTQVWVGSGAVQGDKPDKTATWVYTEV
jgi:hypothetical protein